MGTHKSNNVQKHTDKSGAYCVPSVGRNSLCLEKVKLYTDDFLHDTPDVIERDKRNQSTDSCKDYRKNAKILVAARKNKQLL